MVIVVCLFGVLVSMTAMGPEVGNCCVGERARDYYKHCLCKRRMGLVGGLNGGGGKAFFGGRVFKMAVHM